MKRPDTSDELIRADHLSVSYGGPLVVEDVTLTVQRGDLTGIVGPSGSGKSTLLSALLGVVPATAGTVARSAGVTVGLVPQVERMNWNFPITVAECVAMARATGWRTPSITRSERAEISATLARLGLHDLDRRHIRDLSGGQQQRVFLARALFTGADVVMLDEPTSGLDVKTRHEVLHLFRELNTDGLTIVLSTHDLNGIASHLPRIVCLNRMVIDDGRPEDVLRPDVLEATYGSPMQILEHSGLRVVVDAEAPAPLRAVQ